MWWMMKNAEGGRATAQVVAVPSLRLHSLSQHACPVLRAMFVMVQCQPDSALAHRPYAAMAHCGALHCCTSLRFTALDVALFPLELILGSRSSDRKCFRRTMHSCTSFRFTILVTALLLSCRGRLHVTEALRSCSSIIMVKLRTFVTY